MTKWVIRLHPRRNPRLRLFCFPYAGAAAGIFEEWPGLLPDWFDVVAIELPGRASHFARPALVDIDAVVAELVPELAGFRDLPCVFYGHSLGAKLGFELACDLQRRELPLPAHLIAAARAAPHRVIKVDENPADFNRDEFVALLARLAATPSEILQNRELMDLLLPTIRADFSLNLSASKKPRVTLRCPITALHGMSDSAVSTHSVRDWAELTTGKFELLPIEGGHFFMRESARDVLKTIVNIAAPLRFRD